MASHVTEAEVLELLVHRTITAHDATNPSVVTKSSEEPEDEGGDVLKFITIIDRRIDLKLELMGVIGGEVSETVYVNGLKEIARLMVIGIIESKFKADVDGDEESGELTNSYYKLGEKLLDELVNSVKMNLVPTFFDGTKVDPHFEIDDDKMW